MVKLKHIIRWKATQSWKVFLLIGGSCEDANSFSVHADGGHIPFVAFFLVFLQECSAMKVLSPLPEMAKMHNRDLSAVAITYLNQAQTTECSEV